MKTVITGGSGFIGKALIANLQRQGHTPIILTRRPIPKLPDVGCELIQWDDTGTVPLPPHDAAIHLSGEPIAGYWTESKKKAILESRRDGTHRLVDAILSLPPGQRPHVLVSASAVGYYGDRGEELLFESSDPGAGFLSGVCKAWEEEAIKAESAGIRVVRIRLGIVLGPNGGALDRFLPPFKMGVGGPIGTGRQWFPWVHRADVCGLVLWALDNESVSGPINAVAPGIVRNRQFASTLGNALHRPAWLPTPVPALRLLLGEFADTLIESQRVVPQAATDLGYRFQFPDLPAAIQASLQR